MFRRRPASLSTTPSFALTQLYFEKIWFITFDFVDPITFAELAEIEEPLARKYLAQEDQKENDVETRMQLLRLEHLKFQGTNLVNDIKNKIIAEEKNRPKSLFTRMKKYSARTLTAIGTGAANWFGGVKYAVNSIKFFAVTIPENKHLAALEEQARGTMHQVYEQIIKVCEDVYTKKAGYLWPYKDACGFEATCVQECDVARLVCGNGFLSFDNAIEQCNPTLVHTYISTCTQMKEFVSTQRYNSSFNVENGFIIAGGALAAIIITAGGIWFYRSRCRQWDDAEFKKIIKEKFQHASFLSDDLLQHPLIIDVFAESEDKISLSDASIQQVAGQLNSHLNEINEAIDVLRENTGLDAKIAAEFKAKNTSDLSVLSASIFKKSSIVSQPRTTVDFVAIDMDSKESELEMPLLKNL